MKIAERIVIVSLLVAIFGAAAWFYFAVQYEIDEEQAAAIVDAAATTTPVTDQSSWRVYYPVTVPMVIGDTPVRASVADSLPERIKGLSDTPYLPENLVKLFVFGTEGSHSIWMKDMNYALDIIWVTRDREVVHIEENVSPDTYPESFSSPTPAWYVIEANAGFVASSSIKLGDEVVVYIEE